VSQALFKRIDVKGRCAALEIMLATSAVRNLIREGKTYQIGTVIQTGKKFGMQSLDDAIMEHLLAGRINPNDAYSFCQDKQKFRQYLTTAPDDFTDV
ncbi:MAG: type IV pili twitching motility protein PilT, partial [Candidatus Adiutrix sp.]